MSNFLKQFDNSDYKENSVQEKKEEATSRVTRATKGNDSKNMISSDHIMERDENHHKRKLIRYGIIGGSTLVVCLFAFLIFRMMNQVAVKDFVGTSINDAKTWGLANKITIETYSEYNLEYDEGVIIAQGKEVESNIQKGSILKFTVSMGANPDEEIELPDFSKMSTSEVYAWKQEVKALNVNINEEYNDKVDKNKFIKSEFTDSSITEENYTRKDGLLIYMSKGEEVFEKNITVPNFIEKAKVEVETWASENGVKVIFEEKDSDAILSDTVISQSIAVGEKVAKNDEMTIVISLGIAVTVPNFNGLTMDEAAGYLGLEVQIQTRYSSDVAYGKVISQSEPAGKELIGDSLQVTVIYSLGRPYIDNLVGGSEKDIPEYFYNFTSQGANITYTVTYIDSSEPKGTIVSVSKYGQYIGLKDHVEISVSKGNLAGADVQSEGSGEDDEAME